MTNKDRSTLLYLINDGKVEKALTKLLSIQIDESRKKETIAISSRFNKLRQQHKLGILSFEQFKLTENQITNHLLDLINQQDGQPFAKEKSINASDTKDAHKKKAIGYWIGIIGSIASVVGLLLYFLPLWDKPPLQLTVYVTDTKGNVVLEHEGVLNTSIGNRPMREAIGEHGRTNFGDILPEYLGDTITIGFIAEGWEIIDRNNIFVFSGKPIRLKVKKDDSLGIVKGIVKTRNGQDFIEGAQVLINADTTILTNVNGIFTVILPERMRVKSVAKSYKLTISKDGYKTRTEYFYTKSSDAEIRLEKTE